MTVEIILEHDLNVIEEDRVSIISPHEFKISTWIKNLLRLRDNDKG